MGIWSTLFRRSGQRGEEQRAISSLPWNIGGSRYEYGVDQERALTLAPVFASVRHITDFGSTLPLKGYRDIGEFRQPMPTLPKLFADLDERGELVPWLCQAISSLVVRGNAVGMIMSRDGFGFPSAISWLPMSMVSVRDPYGVSGMAIWYVEGRAVPRSDLVHIPWITVPGQTLGLSPIEYYALTIGAGLDTWRYGADWFRAGGIPPGTFKNTQKTISPDAARTIRQRLIETIRGHEPLVYGSDWDYNPITIPPNQAQFVETQKFTTNQVAAMYGINAIEIGGEPPNGLVYSNEARRAMQRLSNIQPYLTRFERAFASWLPERQYVKFNGDAIVRADIETRWQVYKVARDIGAMNVDEIRALEDQPPLPDGQGQDYTPTKQVEEKEPEVAPGAPPEPSTPPTPRQINGTPQSRVIELLGKNV